MIEFCDCEVGEGEREDDQLFGFSSWWLMVPFDES